MLGGLPEWLLRWPGAFAAWTLVGLLFMNRAYYLVAGTGEAVAWTPLVAYTLESVWLWAAFTPAIVALARRYRIGGDGWQRSLSLHLAAAVVLAAADVTCDRAFARVFSPGPSQPLGLMYVQQLPGNLFSYFAVVAVAHAADFYALFRDREVQAARLAAQVATAQLRELQAQLHPHMLFNTLNGLSELVHRDPSEADRLIIQLGKLLRRSFETLERPVLPLARELEFLQAYLDLMGMRLRGRLAVALDVDPTTLDAEVPALLLQPLVENAVRHGIEPSPPGGTVRITTRRCTGVADVMELEVADDGCGLGAAAAVIRDGAGLRITRARLERLYPGDYRLSVRPRPEGGVVSAVVIPYRPATRTPDLQHVLRPDPAWTASAS